MGLMNKDGEAHPPKPLFTKSQKAGKDLVEGTFKDHGAFFVTASVPKANLPPAFHNYHLPMFSYNIIQQNSHIPTTLLISQEQLLQLQAAAAVSSTAARDLHNHRHSASFLRHQSSSLITSSYDNNYANNS